MAGGLNKVNQDERVSPANANANYTNAPPTFACVCACHFALLGTEHNLFRKSGNIQPQDITKVKNGRITPKEESSCSKILKEKQSKD